MPFDQLTSGIDGSPYLPTFLRLLLALALGLFIGLERERQHKEAGLRTFAFAALLGASGGLLGQPFALSVLGLAAVLIVLLNVETFRTGEGVELTTSAALLLTTFVGILAGAGHTFTPTVLGVTTAALLAWKGPLSGFSKAITESELRSAVLLALMTFVAYPVLPEGPIDPGGYVNAREAWTIVLLISGLGFLNYVLLKIYGARGLGIASLLGGLINSTATVAALTRDEDSTAAGRGRLIVRAVLMALGAMLLRNAVILGVMAPAALLRGALSLAWMCIASFVLAHLASRRRSDTPEADDRRDNTNAVALPSPFSVRAALQFAAILVAVQVGAEVAQPMLGDAGVYGVSALGGLISSASTTASVATLLASSTIPASTAATAAVLASIMSALVTIPLLYRLADGDGTRKTITLSIATICAIGIGAAFAQTQF